MAHVTHTFYCFTDLADRLVRTIPAEDLTNGFFVSCFIRKSAASEANKRPLEEDQQTAASKSPNKKKKKNNKKKKAALTQ